MTDGQSLLLLFVALYLIESLRWLPARTHLLSGSGHRWGIQRPFQPLELAGASPTLLSVLPPLQAHLHTLPWQVIPAAAGVELHQDERRPQWLSWDQVTPSARGRSLHLSPKVRVRCLSEAHAHAAQQQVQRWLPMSVAEREADFLQYAEQTLTAAPVAAQASALTDQTRPMRHLGSLIFVWTFLVMVFLYRWLGDGGEILIAAAMLLALQFTQTFFFIRRSQGIAYRYWKALAIALLPQHAMRAADHLSDCPAHSPSHPLAARVLLGDEAWQQLARHFWKQARYLPSATADLQCKALQTFLEKAGLPLSELETAPAQQKGSAAYCPNCQAQFQAGANVCKDCGGVELRVF